MDLILASQSPRREKLLSEMGYTFRVISSTTDEIEHDLIIKRIPLINADLKAIEVSKRFPDSLVIGADTIIEFNNKCLGKPENSEDARSMLAMLSGNSHCVITAVSLRMESNNLRILYSIETEVIFKIISEVIITKYMSLVNTLDKGGAYAIQEYGDMLIESIQGPEDNVVGLPCDSLRKSITAAEKGIQL